MNKLVVICMVFLLNVLPGVATAGSLTDNGNGTVTDSGTLLMWQQGEGGAMTWEAALSYCEGLVLPSSGYSDWRLPNHKELLSLVDDTSNPSINITKFPGAFSSLYWSSTTYAGSSSLAWTVNFYFGYSNYYNKTTDAYYARCVRGGQ